MTLLINNKCLNNCMLDSGAGANMMSLKVMEKLGLKSHDLTGMYAVLSPGPYPLMG
jgi:hypothetical protein